MKLILTMIFFQALSSAQMPGTAQFSFFKKHSSVSTDPCNGKSIGQTGSGTTAICAGTFNSATYMVTPGGCNNSTTPTCSGSTDTVSLLWGAFTITTGQTSTTTGSSNTAYLSANYSDTAAAKFCKNMNYGGYADWFLPAKDELNYLYTKKASIAGFNTSGSYYWSSTEYNGLIAWVQRFSDGLQYYYGKNNAYLVRCVRRY